jgi:membrane protein implicated in regulation of membrane protease activity
MGAWLLWVIVAAICAALETLTLTLILGFVAVAAVVAMVVALVGAPVALQLVAFIVGSAALLGVVRPIARNHLRTPLPLRTGVEALVGSRALVVEQVDAHHGQVKIGGEVWSARAYDETQVLAAGTSVDVIKIEGATALVYGSES